VLSTRVKLISNRLTLTIFVFFAFVPAVNGQGPGSLSADLAAVVEAVHHGECANQLPLLQALSDRSGPSGARAAYLRAYCLEQTGQPSEARAAYEAVALRYRPLAPYATFAAARLAVGTGAAADATDRLGELLAHSPSTALARRARLPYAEALLQADRAAEASTLLLELARTAQDDAIVARAWWLLGAARERAADPIQAQHAYAMAWWAVPDSPFAPQALERLKGLAGGAVADLPAEARLERGKRLAAASKTVDAEQELTAVLHQTPSAALAAEAWYHLGRVQLGSKKAIYAFEQALRYPDNAARGLYWLGEALAATGRSREAKATWWRLSRERPGSSWAARSLYSLAISAESERAWGTADSILAEIAVRFPGSGVGDQARWRRGWLKYRLGRYADAEARFLAAARTAPGSARAADALYWASKAREQQRRDPRALLAEVAKRYPLTYSGQRARLRLGGLPPPRQAAALAPVSLRDDRFYALYEELAALGFDREAADEAERVLETSPTLQLHRFVALHRARAGDLRASVGSAEVAIEPALHGGAVADGELWTLAYPRAYWDQVSSIAATTGIDPYLLLAVMREESRFDPQAVSPAGAIGLMQLMPYTARTLADGQDVPVQTLMQPEVSIRYGATYLSGVLKEFGGDLTLALAAYNAGPAAAHRFARASRSDPDLFVANIPYAETRGYVQVVLETYGIYRWLYQ